MHCLSFCPQVGRGSHVTITHDVLDLTIQGPLQPPPPKKYGTSFYRDPQGWPSPSPTPILDMFKLHYEARTVGKRTIHILVECFLVQSYFHYSVSNFSRDMPEAQFNWTILYSYFLIFSGLFRRWEKRCLKRIEQWKTEMVVANNETALFWDCYRLRSLKWGCYYWIMYWFELNESRDPNDGVT